MSDSIQAVTINYFYDSESNCTRVTVTWTLDGCPKEFVTYKFINDIPSKELPNRIKQQFIQEWSHRKIPEPTLKALAEALGKALRNKYDNPFQWNTHFGGTHASSFVWDGPVAHYPPYHQAVIERKSVSDLATLLPGVYSRVTPPCECCQNKGLVYVIDIIQHLNDRVKWSREKIADWLDTLHDEGKVDLEFQPWDETGMAEEEKDLATGGELDPKVVSTLGHLVTPSSHYQLQPDGGYAKVGYTDDFGNYHEMSLSKEAYEMVKVDKGSYSIGPFYQMKKLPGGENDNSNGAEG